MTVHRSLFVLLLGTGLVLGLNGSVRGEEYRNSQLHCSLQLPANWVEMPADAIRKMNILITQRMPAANIRYVTGFQRSTDQPMRYPYILVQPVRFAGSTTSYEELEQMLAKEFKTAVKQAEGAFSDVAKAFDVGTPVLSRANNRLVMRLELDVQGAGKVKGLSVGFLGLNEMVMVHCYALAPEFDRMMPTFEPLLNSFRFDPGFEFKPGSSSVLGKVGGGALEGAIVGAIVGALILVPLFLIRRFRKPKEPAAAG